MIRNSKINTALTIHRGGIEVPAQFFIPQSERSAKQGTRNKEQGRLKSEE
jgi:hypothetical protein